MLPVLHACLIRFPLRSAYVFQHIFTCRSLGTNTKGVQKVFHFIFLAKTLSVWGDACASIFALIWLRLLPTLTPKHRRPMCARRDSVFTQDDRTHRVDYISPCLITSDDVLYEVWVVVCTVQGVLSDFYEELLLQLLVNEFCRHLFPTRWVFSWIVTRWSPVTIRRNFSIDSSFRFEGDMPEHATLSAEVHPCLKRLYRSLIWVLPLASLPKTCWAFWVVSTWVFTKLLLKLDAISLLDSFGVNKNLVSIHSTSVL